MKHRITIGILTETGPDVNPDAILYEFDTWVRQMGSRELNRHILDIFIVKTETVYNPEEAP